MTLIFFERHGGFFMFSPLQRCIHPLTAFVFHYLSFYIVRQCCCCIDGFYRHSWIYCDIYLHLRLFTSIYLFVYQRIKRFQTLLALPNFASHSKAGCATSGIHKS